MKKIILALTLIICSSAYSQMPSLNYVKKIALAPNTQFSSNDVKSITTDALGNIYIVGLFSGVNDFDNSASSFTLQSNGSVDFYVAKYDKDGLFNFAFKVGGNNNESNPLIKLDNDGNIIVIGGYQSNQVDFDPSSAINNAPNPLTTNYTSSFISKYTSSGSFIWVKSINSTSNIFCNSFDIDNNNNIYISGSFIGNCMFSNSTSTNTLSTINSNPDAFLVKYNSIGNCEWQFNLGNNFNEDANSVSVNTIGEVCVSGKFRGAVDFDPSSNTAILTAPVTTYFSLFLAKYTTSGLYLWAQFVGPTDDTYIESNKAKFDKNNDIVFVGTFGQTIFDFDPSPASFTLAATGGSVVEKIFVSKYSNSGAFISAFEIGRKNYLDNINYLNATDVDSNGDIFVMGVINTTSTQSLICDFDPSAATSPVAESGTGQFIAKYSNNGSYQWVKALPNVYTFCLNVDGGNIIIGGIIIGNATPDFDLTSSTYTISSGPVNSSTSYIVKYGNNTVDIPELSSSNNPFNLYPNPTNSVINVELLVFNKTSTAIEITDVLGKIVLSKTITENTTQLNVSELTKGIYFVTLKTDNKKNTQKLIVD